MSVHTQKTVNISETGNGLYQNAIIIGDHKLLAGEPKELGGDDSGPTPMELASAALGSCTTITLRMYANRKDWPLERVSAQVTHKKAHVICAMMPILKWITNLALWTFSHAQSRSLVR